MTDAHALLEQLAEQTAIAMDAVREGDAAGAAATLEAREGLVVQLGEAMSRMDEAARRDVETGIGAIVALDRELNALLLALRDQMRDAIEATRAARASATNPNRAPAPARFVSQRA